MGIFDDLFLLGLSVAEKAYEVKEKIMEAAQEQANEDIAILNKVNEKNKQIVQETNELIDKTRREYKDIIRKTIEQKNNIYDYVVKPYITLIEPIKKFAAKKPQVMNINTMEKLETIKYEDMHRSEYKCNTMLHILTRSQTLGFGGGIIKSVKVSLETDKANEETARLTAEQEKVIARCKAINKVTEFMKEAYAEVENVTIVTSKQINRMELLIKNKGYNVDSYNGHDLLFFAETGNLVDLLIKIITTHLTSEEGIINPIYKRYIEQIKEIEYDKDR